MTKTLFQGSTVEEVLDGSAEDISNVREVDSDKDGWKLRSADYGENMQAFGIYTENEEFVKGVIKMDYGDHEVVETQNIGAEEFDEQYNWVRQKESEFAVDKLSNVGTEPERNWHGY